MAQCRIKGDEQPRMEPMGIDKKKREKIKNYFILLLDSKYMLFFKYTFSKLGLSIRSVQLQTDRTKLH